MPTCINLRERFGDRYRIEHDAAFSAEYGQLGRTDDPWLLLIPGALGHIFPWGEYLLAVWTNCRGSVAAKIAALTGIEVVQVGDDGITATFPNELFDQIAKLIKARRRRKLSAKQREASVERLAKYRFSPARQSDFDHQIPLQRALDDQRHHFDAPRRS